MKLVLALLLLCATAARAELHGVVIHLRAHGDRAVFLLDLDDPEFGFPVGVAFLKKHAKKPEDTACARVLMVLREPAVRSRIQQMLDFSGRPNVHVFLILTDAADAVYRGERIRVPLGTTGLTVPIGALVDRPLAPLARLLGTTPAEIARHDPERFEVFPHSTEEPPPRGATVYVGERGIVEACGHDLPLVRQMLLHEIAHCCDLTPAGGERGDMSELTHAPWTVLPPRRALTEGWADYWSTQLPGEITDIVDRGPPPRVVELGRFAMLRCSAVVTAVLADLAHLAPGPRALLAAMRAACRRPASTLLDVLAAYHRANPGQTLKVAESLARRTRGQGTPVDYLLLACGRIE